MKDTLYFGSDHAGFALKQYLIEVLSAEYDCIDCGPATFDKQDDYPDFARIVCEKVIEHNGRGILICDTGIGMSIAANRYSEIRATLVTTPFMAQRSRLHNDSNVICLGQDLVSQEENEAFVRTWLTTSFEAVERHIRRIHKLDMLG
jgi:ribose 5-phosphate isomerase B